MRVKSIVEEDFVNYHEPSLFLGTCSCTFKCCQEGGFPITVCQNSELSNAPVICVDNSTLLERYQSNPLTRALVFGGLEPFLQFDEVFQLCKTFRDNGVNDDIVIYTGYTEDEVGDFLKELRPLGNIIVKFDRYKPNSKTRFDSVLGVTLSSENQHAVRI